MHKLMPIDLIPGRMYRIAPGCTERAIAGKPVVYRQTHTVRSGGPAHEVTIVNADGSCGAVWFVQSSLLCLI
jgi:hypothetical protein